MNLMMETYIKSVNVSSYNSWLLQFDLNVVSSYATGSLQRTEYRQFLHTAVHQQHRRHFRQCVEVVPTWHLHVSRSHQLVYCLWIPDCMCFLYDRCAIVVLTPKTVKWSFENQLNRLSLLFKFILACIIPAYHTIL